MKDLYYILGVANNATPAEIDNAFAVLSARLKPVPGDNEHFLQNHFNEITDAYAILSNPAKRKVYDANQKRAHLRQLSRFKAKTTNALIGLSVVLVTGLFGFYLVTLINSHKGPKKIATTDSVVAVQTPKKHHKRKHHAKALIARNRPVVAKPKALPVMPVAKPVIAVVPPVKVAAEANKPIVSKPVAVAVAKPAIVKKDTARLVKSVAAEAPVKHLILVKSTTQRDSSYIAYLKNNLRDSVYMHQLADYMSPVVSVLAANAKVRVLEKGRIFYKVALAKGTGYIPKWSLAKP